MKTSEQIDLLIPALVKAQAAIQAVVKDKTGKVQSKSGASYEYKYSDLASVIEQVKPHLNANGIVFTQGVDSDATGVMVETRLIHTSGQWIATTVYLPVNSGTAQAYGSAITYGKRYGLQALTGLPSEDDDGQAASQATRTTVLPRPIPANVEGQDAFASMDPETKAMLDETATTATRLVNEGKDAHGYLESMGFDAETKLALWSQLPSNVRSAIKKQAPKLPLAAQA